MLTNNITDNLPTERFEADLQTICGRFDIRPSRGKKAGWGGVAVEKQADLEITMVATNLQQIIRTQKNISHDGGANYFLIAQQEGRALMAQNNARTMMLPGDMILIDSTKPSEFTFFGDRSKQISLHLPHTEIKQRFGDNVCGGLGLSRNDPTTKALHAVMAKAFQTNNNEGQNKYLREALFSLIGTFLFDRDTGLHDSRNHDLGFGGALLGKALDYIELRFRDPEFSVNDVAVALGVPIRQVQRSFEHLGVTPTKFLLAKRLEFAMLRLQARHAGERDELISNIAYGSGFADISYFNRCFRDAFGHSPRENLTLE